MVDFAFESDRDDPDPDDEVTRGDLAAFGSQLGEAIFEELDRRDADRRRVEAERERLAPSSQSWNAGPDDGTAALRRNLREAGVTEESFAAAVAAAKRADLEQLVQECLSEQLPEALEELIEDMADEAKTAPGHATRRARSPRNERVKTSGASRDAGQAPRVPRDSAPGDDAPENRHWSERPLRDLFR